MSEKLTERASAMLAVNRQHRLRCAALVVASIAIALLTAWFFVFPATSASDSAYCGVEEHQHTAECYAANLICDVDVDSPATETHAHKDTCYVTEQVLSCGFVESQGLSESSDRTSKSAGEQAAEGANLDISGANLSEGSAVSSSEDNSSAIPHAHTDACYEQISALICELEEGGAPETGAHEHNDSCYEQILSCAIEEHTHTLSCYSNSEADVETAANWEATLPSDLSGVWADDLVAIAESQLGYTESDENYLVTDDGKTKGYSRFGAWYGDAYGDWCAMFISFCLSYAGVPEDSFPQEANCQSWAELLSSEDYQLYYPVGEYAVRAANAVSSGETECDGVPADALVYFDASEPYVPLPGDIVFFNWDSVYDSDHVGIVVEVVEATEDEPAKLKTIEGNASDQVKYCEYDLDDPSIMGCGMLPIKPEGEAVAFETNSGGVNLLGESSTIVPTGTMYRYGINDKYFYQDSSHRIDDGIATTFVLVPKSTAKDGMKFSPERGWTAKTNSNYIVTYCCDLETSVGYEDLEYESHLLEESRISDPVLRGKLAALIAHSYPFISESEMKAELAEAYRNGDIKVDVSASGADEYLAAVQWAIWELTTLDGNLSTASGSKFAFSSQYVLARLGSAGLTNNSQIQNQCKAIKDYLVSLPAYPGAIEIADYNASVNQDSDGLFSLTVEISLNREMRDDESLTAYLETEQKTSSVVAVQAGESKVTLQLQGLTEEELHETEVSVTGSGAHMQAYHFNSPGKQDMIGGRWEKYPLDLSFTLTRETTSLAVAKSWVNDDGAHPESVSIQLLRDGKHYGDQVDLNANNDWSYVWDELPKYDYKGAEYSYTVKEIVPDGYEATVAQVDPATSSISVWKSVETLKNGGTYVIASPLGALSTNGSKSTALEWNVYDVSSADSASSMVQWTASSSNSGWSLTNKGNGKKLTYKDSSFSFGNGSTVYLSSDRNLYAQSGNKAYYMTDISDSKGKTTTDQNAATVFTVYELQTEQVPVADRSFHITNALIATTAVSVEKRWIDSGDPHRPESIQVALLANGKSIDTVDVAAAENWTYMWEDLPLRDDSGEMISYSVEEVTLKGYDTEVVADGNHFTITNTKDYYVLPETGGIGAGVLIAFGIGLLGVFATSFTVWFRKRREEV